MDGSINQFPEQAARDNIDKLTAYDKTVDRNFQKWVFEKQAGALKFDEEQMNSIQNQNPTIYWKLL